MAWSALDWAGFACTLAFLILCALVVGEVLFRIFEGVKDDEDWE